MTAPEPTPATPPPAEDSQGSLGAVLIGGAILVVAALLIFWPDGDSASQTQGGAADRGNAAQANSAGSSAAGSGQARSGVAPREHDPAEGRVNARINPALGMPARGMAPPKPAKPEPTSFPSAAAEIAHYEKKLEEARNDLTARTTFLERMKRLKENAKTPADVTRAESRGLVVQENYDRAKQKVADLEQKLAGLREKQSGTAG
jgi:hypothetical protein